jgi:hypothetical protein
MVLVRSNGKQACITILEILSTTRLDSLQDVVHKDKRESGGCHKTWKESDMQLEAALLTILMVLGGQRSKRTKERVRARRKKAGTNVPALAGAVLG